MQRLLWMPRGRWRWRPPLERPMLDWDRLAIFSRTMRAPWQPTSKRSILSRTMPSHGRTLQKPKTSWPDNREATPTLPFPQSTTLLSIALPPTHRVRPVSSLATDPWAAAPIVTPPKPFPVSNRKCLDFLSLRINLQRRWKQVPWGLLLVLVQGVK